MRVLVVEDEKRTASYLEKGLGEQGFIVDVAHNGVDGEHLAVTTDYDVIVLDVSLPGRSGWEVVQAIRKAKSTPLLFLTARDQVDDRVKGLELGADDYLVKPFAFSELLARVRSLLRLCRSREPDVLEIADLQLHVIRRLFARSGQRISLTPKEFALLSLLVRRRGEVLSRTLIAEQVWDMNFDSDTNVVDVAIRRLRAKVDDPFATKLIHTIRGVGYVCDPERGS